MRRWCFSHLRSLILSSQLLLLIESHLLLFPFLRAITDLYYLYVYLPHFFWSPFPLLLRLLVLLPLSSLSFASFFLLICLFLSIYHLRLRLSLTFIPFYSESKPGCCCKRAWEIGSCSQSNISEIYLSIYVYIYLCIHLFI